MAPEYESFWNKNSFAVVGHSGNKRKFPRLTYSGLKKSGKTVHAVDAGVADPGVTDPGADRIEGDKVYPDFASLPDKVEAAVLELPGEETAGWVDKAAEAGIKEIWIHMRTDTPQAVDLAREKGIKVHTGTCAVMYVTPGLSYHSIHKWIFKLLGKY